MTRGAPAPRCGGGAGPDGWPAATAAGSRPATFEHTVVVTPSGVEVLTWLPDEQPGEAADASARPAAVAES